MSAASIVDGDALVQLLWVSAAAGLVFVGAFSVAIFGAARSNHQRREGRSAAAGLYLLLGGAAGLVCVAAVVLGIAVMVHK